jgi:hypothetical protein
VLVILSSFRSIQLIVAITLLRASPAITIDSGLIYYSILLGVKVNSLFRSSFCFYGYYIKKSTYSDDIGIDDRNGFRE